MIQNFGVEIQLAAGSLNFEYFLQNPIIYDICRRYVHVLLLTMLLMIMQTKPMLFSNPINESYRYRIWMKYMIMGLSSNFMTYFCCRINK